MNEPDSHITIPATIDGLDQAAGDILSEEGRLLDNLRELIIHAKIREEYQRLKKIRGRGQAAEIRREMAEKYFNNPDRTEYIKHILYRKY